VEKADGVEAGQWRRDAGGGGKPVQEPERRQR
jgi:hypothetical protein